MRALLVAAMVILIAGCELKTQKTTTPEKDKTSAEKAYDAGDRARKKAEQIKKEQEKKLQEANDSGN